MSYEQLKEVNKETGKSLLEEEFDRLTTVRTMVSKSLFVQRVKLKGDGNKNTSKFTLLLVFPDDKLFQTCRRYC